MHELNIIAIKNKKHTQQFSELMEPVCTPSNA
jgi:hypothetical protein